MNGGSLRLGIDFGTSSTVAVLERADGRVSPMLFGETPLLPSAVWLDPGGELLVGRDALHAGRSRPEFLEPNPKRRVDDGTVLLGDQDVPVVVLIAGVLRRVADEAQRVGGGPISETVVTCPATWGATRRQVLRDAARTAGLGDVLLLAEPVAAASYFVRVLGNDIPDGSGLVVYDFGAGTFDASLVRRTADGFTVLAEEGLPDAGGLDIDAAIVTYLGETFAGDLWARLIRPASPADRRANRLLWEDVRHAKETLSRASSTTMFVPLLDADAPLGREQLEQLARPVLDRTIGAVRRAVDDSGVEPGRIFLVGGSSRMPLAATLLHRAFGIAPVAIEQPEVVVAEGSLHAPRSALLGPEAPEFTPTVALPASDSSTGTGRAGLSPAESAPPEPTTVTATPAEPAAPVARPTAPAEPTTVAVVPPAVAAPAEPTPTPVKAEAAATPSPAVESPPSRVEEAPPTKARRSKLIVPIAVAVVLVLVIGGVVAVARYLGANAAPTVYGSPACGRSLGFMGALSGSGSEIVTPMRDAAKLAVQEYNTQHASCRVSLVEFDTQNDPDKAKAAVAGMGFDLVGIVGPTFGEEARGAGPALQSAGVPYIVTSAHGDDLGKHGWDTFHSASPTQSELAGAAAKYLGQTLKQSKVYVVAETDVDSELLKAAFTDSSAITVTAKTDVEDGADLDALAGTIAHSKANAVFFAGYSTKASALLKPLRAAGFQGAFVANDAVFDSGFPGDASDTSNSTYVICPCRPAGTVDSAAELVRNFNTAYGNDGNYLIGVGYDATGMLLKGIANGADTRTRIRDTLDHLTYTGVMGSYRFAANGELVSADVRFSAYRLEDGSLTYHGSL